MKKLLILPFILFSLVSCKGFLNVNPKSKVLGKKLLDSPDGFEDALYGVYASMRSPSLYGGQLSYLTLDVLAQYYKSDGNTFITNLNKYNYSDKSVRDSINTVWGDMYNRIAMLNNILIHLKKFNDGSFPLYNVYKGEALGLRAFLHFDLLRLFAPDIKLRPQAKGIPYSTDFSSDPPKFLSNKKVYQHIIEDLKKAEQLLAKDKSYFTGSDGGEKFLNDRSTHFNLYAAEATLARVYLTKGDMEDAYKYANKVIESHKFRLLKSKEINLSLRGTLYPQESIFGLYSRNYFGSVRDRFYNTTSFFSLDLNPMLLGKYNTNSAAAVDKRKSYYFGFVGTGANGKTRFLKLVDHYRREDQEYLRPDNLIEGINLIRLPEMYYIAAEALVRMNRPEEARDYLDPVLASRGLVPLSQRMPEQLPSIEMVTKERYKELIGEGQAFFNMKRLHLDINDVYGQTIPASQDIYVWPIPDDEIEFRN